MVREGWIVVVLLVYLVVDVAVGNFMEFSILFSWTPSRFRSVCLHLREDDEADVIWCRERGC